MGMFFIYSIKVAICLVAFYLFYKLLLSRDTFHAFNRATLLLLMLLSLVLPFVSLSIDEPTVVNNGMVQVEQLLVAGVTGEDTQPASLTLVQVLFMVYMVGVVVSVGREIVSLAGLYKLISGRDHVTIDNGIRIIVIDGDMAPFSWFNNIVISRSDYESGRREILIHEMAHISHHHSLDILLCNVLLIFQWFNPAVWLLRRELRNIHEYEADEAVLASGANAAEYQLLLIRKAVGERLFSMANNLNHNSLKKRITMMLTKRSNPWNRVKVLLTVPVAAVAVVAFATPKAESLSREIEHESDAIVSSVVKSTSDKAALVAQGKTSGEETVNDMGRADDTLIANDLQRVTSTDDDVYEVVEKMPKFPGGGAELMKYLSSNIKYPVEAHKAGIQGRVVVSFVVNKDGTVKDAKIVRSVDKSIDAEALRVISAMPKWQPGYQDGKAVSVRYTVPVTFRLTGESRKIQSAEAGNDNINVKMSSDNNNVNISFKDTRYYVINGVHVDAAEVKKISADKIKEIVVLKGEKAIEKFGEQARDGAIVVTTE